MSRSYAQLDSIFKVLSTNCKHCFTFTANDFFRLFLLTQNVYALQTSESHNEWSVWITLNCRRSLFSDSWLNGGYCAQYLLAIALFCFPCLSWCVSSVHISVCLCMQTPLGYLHLCISFQILAVRRGQCKLRDCFKLIALSTTQGDFTLHIHKTHVHKTLAHAYAYTNTLTCCGLLIFECISAFIKHSFRQHCRYTLISNPANTLPAFHWVQIEYLVAVKFNVGIHRLQDVFKAVSTTLCNAV